MSRSFTVYLKLDYQEDKASDKAREEAIRTGKFIAPVGSFWQYSISEIRDVEQKQLAQSSVLQIENAELKLLLKDLFNRLPRFLDEQGLPNK